MSTLQNKKIKDTYEGLLKTSTNLALTGSLTEIQDGTGQNSGVKINNLGEVELNKLKFTALEDGNAVEINDFLVSSEPFVASNTKIPTVESVKNYVDSSVTAQDLDFSADAGAGSIDLDSETLIVKGTNGLNTSVVANELIISASTLEDAVELNTAKVGITPQQASDITTNNAKVGITSQQANDITTNNSKVGYTEALVSANSSVVANTAKVGITPAQTDAIVNNTTNIGTINTTAEFIVNKGQPSGYVPLDANSKILETYLPSSIIGSLKYIGTWNANTNNPTLPDPTTVNGNYYIVNTAGTYLSTSYSVGDWIVSNGIDWQKIDNTDAVSTVFGRVGNILANSSDYDTFYPTLTDLPNLVTNNTAVVANTAKVGITTQQSADIVTNNSKVGITTQQANDIVTNNAKVGITTQQAADITTNNSKVGITTTQANEIIANTAKVGITTSQADEITANNAKISFDSVSSTRLANTSGTNTGDQDLSGYLLNTTDTFTGDLTIAGNTTLYSSGDKTLTIGAQYGGGTELRLLPASTSGYARINVNNTNAPLDFQMNGDTKMQLLTNGFLGIGTINPANPLSVRSPYINSGDRTLATLKFDSGFGYSNTVLKVDIPDYGTGIRITSPTASGNDNGAMNFYQQTSFVGSININSSSTSYNTTSDYRLKENREEILDAIERVKELKPAKFNWIKEPKGKKVDGFYAHELKEVIPEAVTGEKDELDYEDKPKYQSVDQSKVVPLLTAALQQAINKIEELELRINKLEI